MRKRPGRVKSTTSCASCGGHNVSCFDCARLAIPKIRRGVDDSYRQWVSRKRCLACSATASDAHHIETVGSGGSDYCCIPLCRSCHTEFHKIGIRTFAERHRIDLWRAAHGLVVEYAFGGGYGA